MSSLQKHITRPKLLNPRKLNFINFLSSYENQTPVAGVFKICLCAATIITYAFSHKMSYFSIMASFIFFGLSDKKQNKNIIRCKNIILHTVNQLVQKKTKCNVTWCPMSTCSKPALWMSHLDCSATEGGSLYCRNTTTQSRMQKHIQDKIGPQ